MTTRLHKLLDLLKSQSPLSRDQAVRRLVETAAEHPEECISLLSNLQPYVLDTSWDVRTAAVEAFAGILGHCDNFTFDTLDVASPSYKNAADMLASFDLQKLLENSAKFDSGAATEAFREKDVSKNRKNLEQALGLNPALGLSSQDIVDDTDLQDSEPATKVAKIEPKPSPSVKKEGSENTVEDIFGGFLAAAYDPAWEKRHGAVLVLKAFAKVLPNEYALSMLLELALKLLALDRFCDFKDSHVSVPVRDCAAEILSVTSSKLFAENMRPLLSVLEQFLPETVTWECRLSGLLCLKYLGESQSITFEENGILNILLTFFKSNNDDLVYLAGQVCVRVKGAWKTDSNYAVQLAQASLAALKTPGDDFLVSTFLSLYHFLAVEKLVSISDSIEDFQFLLPNVENPMVDVRRQSLELLRIKSENVEMMRGLCSDSVLILTRLLFQRLLCEPRTELHSLICAVWDNVIKNSDLTILLGALCPYFGYWLSCLMIPPSDPVLDASNVISLTTQVPEKILIGGDEVMSLTAPSRNEVVLKAQTTAAQCLSLLVPLICRGGPPADPDAPAPTESFIAVLKFHLNTNSYYQHRGCLFLLQEVAKRCDEELLAEISAGLHQDILNVLLSAESNPTGVINFDEVGLKVADLNTQCKMLVADLAESREDFPEPPENAVFSIDQALTLLNLGSAESRDVGYLRQLVSEVKYCMVSIKSLYAAVALQFEMTEDLTHNDIIGPIFSAVKMLHGELQRLACKNLVFYLQKFKNSGSKMRLKMSNNLLIYLSDDKTITPEALTMEVEESAILSLGDTPNSSSTNDVLIVDNFVFHDGIKTLLLEMCQNGLLQADWPELFGLLQIDETDLESRRILQKLQLVETVAATLTIEDISLILTNEMFDLLGCSLPTVRHMAARGMTALIGRHPATGLNFVLPKLLFFFDSAKLPSHLKCGIAELIHQLAHSLEHKLIGWYPLFALDTLRLMSDSTESVRTAAALSFATIISLLPLEVDTKIPEGMSPALVAERESKMSFIRQMSQSFDAKMKPKLPFELAMEPRPYQWEGIQWLNFLRQYHLNGILADDMGVGKTLMALVSVLMSHRSAKRKVTSLVITPPSCVGHWAAECDKLFANDSFITLQIESSPQAKLTTHGDLSGVDIVFTSYEVVRRCKVLFSDFSWHYVVLDEGHLIRNHKSELAQTIFKLTSDHRLILSGTPIQNSVSELWSAFNFLLPGYLGNHASFQAKFSKPIEKTKAPKVSKAEFEAGQNALDKLHKRALPFVLRRLKSSVLKDLPPKIIQDFYCDLTPLQREMYDSYLADFNEERGKGVKVHPLALLRSVRLLCDHPHLVDPEKSKTMSSSGKLLALAEILQECGIGNEPPDDEIDSVVSPHRALIFCQFKSVISLLEHMFITNQLGRVAYAKLDGSVPPSQRQAVVDKFNNDPSIDVLLLTTQVGGLGLTLTAADTVIFLDQDWNPARDLQAMDRAHRIGQTRTVNVYRIVTRKTIEERIRQLQVVKTNIAETVVDASNASLVTMATDQLLDLLDLDDNQKKVVTSDIDQLWGQGDV